MRNEDEVKNCTGTCRNEKRQVSLISLISEILEIVSETESMQSETKRMETTRKLSKRKHVQTLLSSVISCGKFLPEFDLESLFKEDIDCYYNTDTVFIQVFFNESNYFNRPHFVRSCRIFLYLSFFIFQMLNSPSRRFFRTKTLTMLAGHAFLKGFSIRKFAGSHAGVRVGH
jgi:hypothetical protein